MKQVKVKIIEETDSLIKKTFFMIDPARRTFDLKFQIADCGFEKMN